jgi:hypothetical protein
MLRLAPLRGQVHPWLTREFSRRVWRWWSGLFWGLRVLALGAAIFVVMEAARLMPGIWRASVDGVGFATFYGTLLVSGYPRIKNVKDPAVRAAARPAAVIAAAGAVLATAGVFLEPLSTGWAARVAVAGAVLLLASVATFAVVSEVTRAVRFFGRAAVVTATLALMAAILLFPPVIVFLMTSGRWPSPWLGGPQEPSWADLMSVAPPATLLLAPQVLRKILPWEDGKDNKTQQLLSAWIAGFAVAFTCIYALVLHFFAGNPVAATPLSGLAIAILFVGVFLWPLYRQIATSCWRLGITDAVKLSEWRTDQRAMLKDIRGAARRARQSAQAASEQASGKNASPVAAPESASRSPRGAQQVSTTSPDKALSS